MGAVRPRGLRTHRQQTAVVGILPRHRYRPHRVYHRHVPAPVSSWLGCSGFLCSDVLGVDAVSDDIKTFARKHAPKMGENVISLFKRILEKHDAALLEVVCEQQTRIQELEAALAKREAVAEVPKEIVGSHPRDDLSSHPLVAASRPDSTSVDVSFQQLDGTNVCQWHKTRMKGGSLWHPTGPMFRLAASQQAAKGGKGRDSAPIH